jgi:hypothetical protein
MDRTAAIMRDVTTAGNAVTTTSYDGSNLQAAKEWVGNIHLTKAKSVIQCQLM